MRSKNLSDEALQKSLKAQPGLRERIGGLLLAEEK